VSEPVLSLNAIHSLIKKGRLEEAHLSIDTLLAEEPSHAIAWHLKGLVHKKEKEDAKAIICFNTALKHKPDFVEACCDLASTLDRIGTLALTVRTYQYLLKIDPQHAKGKQRLKILQQAFKNIEDCFSKGSAFYKRADFENAALAYRRALEIHKGLPEAYASLGLILYDMRRFDEAYAHIQQALALRPDFADALNTLGSIHKATGNHAASIDAYHRVVALLPDNFNAWYNLGAVLGQAQNNDAAINAFEQVVRLYPHHTLALSLLIHRLKGACEWKKAEHIQDLLAETLANPAEAGNPFAILLGAPYSSHLTNAIRWSARNYMTAVPYDPLRLLPVSSRPEEKLRIGYLSSDFCRHATAHLITELFERHDRDRFEIFAYSCGKDDGSPERKRIAEAVDHFIDLKDVATVSAAERISQNGIDILVDLKGYTENQRLDIMALRPAPIQMHYLGYPGTTGAVFIDYFIADTITAPDILSAMFSESLIRLPHSYQINDRSRPLPDAPLSRAACGLPAAGFVFGAFNSPYKITADIFAVWMRLLLATEGSVLWLSEIYPEASANLLRYAEEQGVDPSRLIFAPFAPLAEHLARYQHIDLFLDTSPVCGHTTASDALWSGVPVVALAGDSFISRVSASLLHAVGLPELVTSDLAAYEGLALSLARNPDRLQQLHRYLNEGRLTFPLFDSEATARALEAAYQHAATLHRSNIKPCAFTLNAHLEII